MVDLRDYQDSALIAWRSSGGRGVVCLPTGAGKTRLALAAAQRSKKSTLCLVPTLVLLEQWQASIRKFYSGEIGVVGGGQYKVKPITVATFESAFRKGWQFGDQFDLIVIDEAHHFGDCERDEALEVCTAPFRLGLSATLDESRMERLGQLIGPKVYEQNVRDLIGTALAEFDLSRLLLPLTPAEKKAYQLDFSVFQKFFYDFGKQQVDLSWENFIRFASKSPEGRAALAAHRRAKRVLNFTEKKEEVLGQLLQKYRSHRKLIFTADSQTALLISKRLLIAAITSEIGKVERDTTIDAFRSGTIKSLVSCKVLNEGFDVPDADVAIIVGGSGSDREHIQRIGRVLRPTDGKRARIYELLVAGTSEVKQSHRRGAKLNEPSYA
jgi:superfamily II DNA or RNA helicase